MIGAILGRVLRQQARLLLALAAGLAALEMLIIWIADGFEDQPGLVDLVAGILPPMLSRPAGFGFRHPINLTAGLAMTFVLASLPAADREGGMLELILARPVPRLRYLAAIAIAVAIGAAVLSLALVAGGAAGIALVRPDDGFAWGRLLAAGAAYEALLLAFGGVTLFLATGAPRRGPAVAVASAIVLGTFWIDLLAGLWRPLEAIRPLSPFAWFDPVSVVLGRSQAGAGVAVLLAVFGTASIGAAIRFARRDL